ncbi:MAG: phosphotransferase [Acidobacteria bacterium]|nr:phosphotransferase [Acidobacteriota bacterium]
MMITPANLSYYLIDKGLVSTQSVVDGDLMIVEVTRRNRNFKIIRHQQQSFFLKQIQNWEPLAIATLQREATCYQLAQQEAELAPLAALMPKYFLYDSARHILVTELLQEGENLSEHQRRLGKFPVAIAEKLGQALGTYHHQTISSLNDAVQNSVFPKQVPWILSANQQRAQLFNALSAGNSELLNIVQKYPEFHQALDDIRDQWQFDSLIHGDMKWDNCMVFAGQQGAADLDFKVVDWELADIGDACWDVGAILQAYLAFWIMSIPMETRAAPAQLIEMAQFPLEAMLPAIHAFWKTYIETRQIAVEQRRNLLERCVKFGAARMIQTAYEYLQYSPHITLPVLYMLQVSMNILKSPQEAISDLLEM